MSLEQAIHDRWRAWPSLARREPHVPLVTGWLPPDRLGVDPRGATYVVLECLAQVAAQRVSDGRQLASWLVRFRVFAPELETAKTLVEAIHDRFERQSFAGRDVHVQDMKRRAVRQTPGAQGAWHLEIDYLARTET